MADLTVHTICAIATPPGEGGIGIVRVSGPAAVAVAHAVVRLRSGVDLSVVPSHTVQYADLLPTLVSRSATPLDEALVTVMRAPRSYTGEDTVEISCHGSPLVLQLLCEALVHGGARHAEPGEFTKRAFLNGRIDLTQAEAVIDTIQARTAAGLRLAQHQLRGRLSRLVTQWRDDLLEILAHVEAGIDFTEEDISFIDRRDLIARIDAIRIDVRRLADSFHEGRLLRDGLSVGIVGRPNVGKSSLLNALLRHDRAIVTPIPGTTRDVIEASAAIEGIAVRLFDTAGVRETHDPVEQAGINRTRDVLSEADLLLLVLDRSTPLTDDDYALIEECRPRPVLLALNKSDLPDGLRSADRTALQAYRDGTATLSAKTEEGLDRLRELIRARGLRSGFEPAERAMITQARHRAGLLASDEALGRAREAAASDLSTEFIAVDLRHALDALGEIIGVVTTDDVLDKIFKDFCIGK